MDYEAEINEVKHSIASLQKDVTELKVTQPLLQATLERNVEAHEKLVEALHEIEKAMMGMNNKMDLQSKDIDDIRTEMEESTYNFTKKIKTVEAKVDKIDEEGQFNIRLFFQKYFPWIVVCIGFGMFVVSKVVKF